MAIQIIPEIGAKGIYGVLPPFDTKVKATTEYTCMAVRSIIDIEAQAEDAFTLYYKPLGLTETKYSEDKKAGICIVSLQAGRGNWVYVPTNYIKTYPGSNGVRYTGVLLGAALGAIPDTLDLSILNTSISNVVYDTIGIRPVIKTVVVTPPALILNEDHEVLEAARVANITTRKSDKNKLLDAENLIATLKTKITSLENYIKANLP